MRIAIIVATFCAVVLAGGADQPAALLAKGDAKGAAEAARALTAKDPKNVDAWLVLADACVALDEPALAWEAIEGALEKMPEEARLSLKLGDVFVKLAEREQRTSQDGTTITNYYLDAERMYDEALARDAKLADAVYGKAFVNFYLGRPEEARRLIAECLALQKDHGRAHALQAFMFYGDRKYPEAERCYETALKLDDSDPLTYVRYGHTLLVQGRKDAAKDAYIGALVRHPDDTTAILSGLYYVADRDWRNATPLLREASEKAPKSAIVWYYLGYCEFVNANYDAAVEAFRRADRLQPDNPNFIYFIGYALESKGDAKGALDHYRRALKLSPEHADSAARFEGLIIGMQNDLDKAEALYEELIRLAPGNGWIHNNYGLILRNWAEARGAAKDEKPDAQVRKRLKRSSEIYELAAKILESEAQIQSDTGLLFEYYPAIRDDEKAERYFRRALEISDYTYRDAFDGLDRLCRRAGRWAVLREYAEGVVGALDERGKHAVAPVGSSEPRELPQETPLLLARAKAAIRAADTHLKREDSGG